MSGVMRSMIYCHRCNQAIDTDFDVDHEWECRQAHGLNPDPDGNYEINEEEDPDRDLPVLKEKTKSQKLLDEIMKRLEIALQFDSRVTIYLT